MKAYHSFVLLLGILMCGELPAQLPDSMELQIDRLFAPWNRPDHPGGAVGIIKEGEVVYSKAFGLASLEYLVPNSPSTRFNVASVSKQFTVMGVVLLDQQGELSLDDDVRKHLPDLPFFGDTITIRHLIHHTSGLRSLHALLGLAGWRGDDARSNQDLFRFMKQQKELNFPPGKEYLYCNSGYMLMADIIEKVTGEKFAPWMKANVFRPLGMYHTYVEDDYRRVMPDNATSYHGSYEEGYRRAVEYWGYVGSGNIHSNTVDLLTWMKNYYNPQSGWEEPFERMQTRGILNNGDTLSYAFGISMDRYRGERRLQHGGAIGGYRSFVQVFPEKELGIVVLTNFSSSDVRSGAASLADIMLDLEPEKNELIQADDVIPVHLDTVRLEAYSGHYWNKQNRFSRKVFLREDTLRYSGSEQRENLLIPVGIDTFQMVNLRDRTLVIFRVDGKGPASMTVRIGEEDPIEFFSYKPPEVTGELLESYAGRYYSPELDTHYNLSVQGDTALMGNHNRHGEFRIRVVRTNDLEGDLGLFSDIRIERNKRKKVTGFRVSNGRVRNMWFKKVE